MEGNPPPEAGTRRAMRYHPCMEYRAPCILVASPLLLDPNFIHSVVLVVEHDEQGALGIILNRPLPVTLSHICEESGLNFAGSTEATAWRGGPVDPQRGILLVKGGMPGDEDIADPWGKGPDAYREMYDVIERCVPPMIEHLAWLMSETV